MHTLVLDWEQASKLVRRSFLQTLFLTLGHPCDTIRIDFVHSPRSLALYKTAFLNLGMVWYNAVHRGTNPEEGRIDSWNSNICLQF